MTDLRKKIAAIVADERNGGDPLDIADAIIAALPDLVPDLVWDKHPAGYVASNNCGASFIIDDRQRKPYFLKWPAGSFAPDIRNIAEAKDAANAHHRAQIMAALGVK